MFVGIVIPFLKDIRNKHINAPTNCLLNVLFIILRDNINLRPHLVRLNSYVM